MIIWKYGRKRTLLTLIPLMIIGNSISVVTGLMTSRFITAATNKSMTIFWQTILWGTAALLLVTAINLLMVRVKSQLIMEVNLKIKQTVLQSTARKQLDDSGDALSFMTNDLKLLETKGIENEINILGFVLEFLIAFIVALTMDWLITIAFIAAGLIPAALSAKFGSRIESASEAWSKSNSAYTGQLKNLFEGLAIIQLYQAFAFFTAKGIKESKRLEQALKKMNIQVGQVQQLLTGIAYITMMLLPFSIGVYRIIMGVTNLAIFMGVMQISNSIINPMLNIMTMLNEVKTTKPIQRRIAAITAEQTTFMTPAKVAFTGLKLDDVGLQRDGQQLFEHLKLTVKPGDKVLIMAPSGFGKSSLLKALLGELNFNQGHYQLNQQAVDQSDFIKLAPHFAYITQQPFLFVDSLVNNLTLGDHFSQVQVQKAVAASDLQALVTTKGLDYRVGSDARQLSGGQIQRLEIARAILRQREVVLADEPTSALDETTSAAVQQTLLQAAPTLIQVSHKVPVAVQAQFTEVIHLEDYAVQN
ncbi:ATP-binding cassette domain-containing protein [Lapidilactobacillus wuchangensis]|uniref:ATP-binding cassette domain-containing protein n=1 Tax=Lapidilactobacillus wuchangensis TaxID=2486001 RepID=UPI0013DE173E|nr:ABC transporter ATP-binding protein [Lapidilactobacillus wuchangensis]